MAAYNKCEKFEEVAVCMGVCIKEEYLCGSIYDHMHFEFRVLHNSHSNLMLLLAVTGLTPSGQCTINLRLSSRVHE